MCFRRKSQRLTREPEGKLGLPRQGPHDGCTAEGGGLGERGLVQVGVGEKEGCPGGSISETVA